MSTDTPKNLRDYVSPETFDKLKSTSFSNTIGTLEDYKKMSNEDFLNIVDKTLKSDDSYCSYEQMKNTPGYAFLVQTAVDLVSDELKDDTAETLLKNYGIDNIYGSNTEKAVKYIQKELKITEDGKAGPKFFEAVCDKLRKPVDGDSNNNVVDTGIDSGGDNSGAEIVANSGSNDEKKEDQAVTQQTNQDKTKQVEITHESELKFDDVMKNAPFIHEYDLWANTDAKLFQNWIDRKDSKQNRINQKIGEYEGTKQSLTDKIKKEQSDYDQVKNSETGRGFVRMQKKELRQSERQLKRIDRKDQYQHNRLDRVGDGNYEYTKNVLDSIVGFYQSKVRYFQDRITLLGQRIDHQKVTDIKDEELKKEMIQWSNEKTEKLVERKKNNEAKLKRVLDFVGLKKEGDAYVLDLDSDKPSDFVKYYKQILKKIEKTSDGQGINMQESTIPVVETRGSDEVLGENKNVMDKVSFNDLLKLIYWDGNNNAQFSDDIKEGKDVVLNNINIKNITNENGGYTGYGYKKCFVDGFSSERNDDASYVFGNWKNGKIDGIAAMFINGQWNLGNIYTGNDGKIYRDGNVLLMDADKKLLSLKYEKGYSINIDDNDVDWQNVEYQGKNYAELSNLISNLGNDQLAGSSVVGGNESKDVSDN